MSVTEIKNHAFICLQRFPDGSHMRAQLDIPDAQVINGVENGW